MLRTRSGISRVSARLHSFRRRWKVVLRFSRLTITVRRLFGFDDFRGPKGCWSSLALLAFLRKGGNSLQHRIERIMKSFNYTWRSPLFSDANLRTRTRPCFGFPGKCSHLSACTDPF